MSMSEESNSTQPKTAEISVVEAISRFLKDVERGYSAATRNTYRVGLNGFISYLEQTSPANPAAMAVKSLETDWAVNFLRQRADGLGDGQATERASKATLATYAAALSRFYKWCGVERLLSLPAEEYERMQIRLKEIKGKERRIILSKVPPDEIVEALLKEVRNPRPPVKAATTEKTKQELIWLRDIAIIEALKCTGARVSELTNLTRSDLDLTNRRARAVGKGNKERWLYFSQAAWEALEKYLTTRSRALANITPNEMAAETKQAPAAPTHSRRKTASRPSYGNQPLFARHDRGAPLSSVKPLTSRAVQTLILTLVERAQLDSNITPHKFRHWVATRLLAATGDLAATQDLLGHASPTTTRIYAQVSETTKQNLHRQVFD